MESLPIQLDEIPDDHKSGYVTLIGRPNVGKSTLMNALVGHKLSIVTRKPQTTRHRVLGIHSSEKHQVIFQDTPGVIKPRYRLHELMMRDVKGAIRDADILLFLADATTDEPDTFTLEKIQDQPALLVLTKMDLISQAEALPLLDAYTDLRAFDEVIPTSAVTGFNVDTLLKEILKRLPEGPPYYPKDAISEQPERFFVAEMIREKVFQQYRQEIPYSTEVNVTTFKEQKDRKLLIDAEIVVMSGSHKGIIIGKGGKALKELGTAARKDIEEFLDEPVYLQLHVKVREDWRDKDQFLRSYGYRS